ncbi:hypothetical protein K438DRAFT_1992755 [Mycena galopus ATCC 62051]|nr:hypothetical protein K438DRAFT_1992755 [Mycena galopus ATCC 62051]
MLARLRHRFLRRPARSLHAFASSCNSSCMPYDANSEPCEEEVVDLQSETGNEVRVVLLEKGSEIGSHILSGGPVTSSGIRLFTEKYSIPDLHPPQMKNKGNYIASLSRVAAWFGGITERTRRGDARRGVVTHDAGMTRKRTKGRRFDPGVVFLAWAALLAEGAHESLSGQAVAMYDLRHGKEAQTYEIGVKEVWRVEEREYVPGAKYTPSACTPMVAAVGTVYHMADGPVSISLVVGLDYKIPYIELYRSARYTTLFRVLLAAGAVSRTARALTEGGLRYPFEIWVLAVSSGASTSVFAFETGRFFFAVSSLHYATLSPTHSCAAGVVNTVQIKGTHNAMRTGMRAAEVAFAALHPAARFVLAASPAPFKVGVGGSNPSEKPIKKFSTAPSVPTLAVMYLSMPLLTNTSSNPSSADALAEPDADTRETLRGGPTRARQRWRLRGTAAAGAYE